MGGTGVGGFDTTVAWAVGITAIVALLGVVVRLVWRIAATVDRFIEDWQGEPERPGVPGRPGAIERIAGSEKRLGEVEPRVERLETRVTGLERHVGRQLLDGQDPVGEGLLRGRQAG